MNHVSRPLIGILIATVAAAALWVVMLKPSSSSNSANGNDQSLGAYSAAIDKAHQAAATSNSAARAEGGELANTTPSPGTRPGTTTRSAATSTGTATNAGTATHTGTATRVRASQPTHRAGAQPAPNSPAAVTRALQTGKVLALLFYNPAATDDQAVKQELATVPTHGGKVVKVAVPISQLARYGVVSDQVPVQVSPTLVLIDKARQASTIVGFADQFEIAQRIDDALG